MSTVVAERPKNQTMADRLEASIDRKAAGDISVSAKNGMVMENMTQVMEFSKLMSLGREAIPKHLRENPGACLAICIQAYEWQISPFALANKSYVVNDRLAYEASLYQAVVTRRAPIRGRIRMEYEGDGNNRTCRVWAELADDTGIVDYTSPKFGSINPKNSPLWKNDPDQQLFYFSVRSFARRHFPDVMMGIYTVDEMQDASEALTAVRTAPITLDSLTSPKLVTPQAEETENDQPASDDLGEDTSVTDEDCQAASDPSGSFSEQIEDAMSIAALDKINQEFTAAHGRKEIDSTRLDELLAMYQERKTQLK